MIYLMDNGEFLPNDHEVFCVDVPDDLDLLFRREVDNLLEEVSGGGAFCAVHTKCGDGVCLGKYVTPKKFFEETHIFSKGPIYIEEPSLTMMSPFESMWKLLNPVILNTLLRLWGKNEKRLPYCAIVLREAQRRWGESWEGKSPALPSTRPVERFIGG